VAPFLVQQSPWADFLCSENANHVTLQIVSCMSGIYRCLTGGLYVADDITYKAPGGVLS